MKKLIIGGLSAMFFFVASPINAQDDDKVNYSKEELKFSKVDASPMDLALYRDQDDAAVARVIYSRPQKRNREIFGKLVPYGEVWRTGANEATEVTLYKDMKVADATVKAGNYTLYTIPGEKEWTVILNSKTNTWGSYEYTDKEDKVRINVPVRKAPNTIESLSMAFQEAKNGADLLIGWDNSYVKVPFKNAN
ncbi:DUF2911 domain-containing protein [Christiangramia sp. OXR-203]|jgi:hypothetical protein|uniref:DUF2911 domain-containing protein n=1 Tax=unclassified Christiangramia TaxID=2615027 RepID=UPI002AC9BA8E|nr:DUF2911 domain-containing protein [Christiangramia sp. OXR-203]WPY99210.1 DUF2911 domain-containing protein [Christiangramia sp. OXR-203]